MTDEPIKPANFTHGLNVINFGEVRIQRGLTERPFSSCSHLHLIFDNTERRIWCEDCKKDVPAYEAFAIVANNFDEAHKALAYRERQLEQAVAGSIISLAAKNMDDLWRKRNIVPTCPHCREGLFPEYFKSRLQIGTAGAEIARAKLEKKKRD